MLDFESPIQGLLGVHSRYGLHTRAVTVYRDTLSEGFSHFVTSIAAPVASGWSVCRVGFAPTGKRRLYTAHARSQLMHRKQGREAPSLRWAWLPSHQQSSSSPARSHLARTAIGHHKTASGVIDEAAVEPGAPPRPPRPGEVKPSTSSRSVRVNDSSVRAC